MQVVYRKNRVIVIGKRASRVYQGLLATWGSNDREVDSHGPRYQVCDDSNAECSFFFFKHSIKGKSTVAELLFSLAWEIAAANIIIRRKLLGMSDDGISIDLADPTIYGGRSFTTFQR